MKKILILVFTGLAIFFLSNSLGRNFFKAQLTWVIIDSLLLVLLFALRFMAYSFYKSKQEEIIYYPVFILLSSLLLITVGLLFSLIPGSMLNAYVAAWLSLLAVIITVVIEICVLRKFEKVELKLESLENCKTLEEFETRLNRRINKI